MIDPAGNSPAIPSNGEMIVEGGEVGGGGAEGRSADLPGVATGDVPVQPAAQLVREGRRRQDDQPHDLPRLAVEHVHERLEPGRMALPVRDRRGPAGPIESEYWATADRGRVPLFIKTGQVIDGKMHNEVIRYLTPQQIGARILKDNLRDDRLRGGAAAGGGEDRPRRPAINRAAVGNRGDKARRLSPGPRMPAEAGIPADEGDLRLAFADLQSFIDELERRGQLQRVTAEVDPILEITEIADRVSKMRLRREATEAGAPATDPIHGSWAASACCSRRSSGSSLPVAINLFGSYERVCLALGCEDLEELAGRVENSFGPRCPRRCWRS